MYKQREADSQEQTTTTIEMDKVISPLSGFIFITGIPCMEPLNFGLELSGSSGVQCSQASRPKHRSWAQRETSEGLPLQRARPRGFGSL